MNSLKKTLIAAALLLGSGHTFAQDSGTKPHLEAATPAAPAKEVQAQQEKPAAKPALALSRKPTFTLSAGTMLSSRGGVASYISPTAYYPLSDRFRVFTSLTYLNLQPAFRHSGENTFAASNPFGSQHYLLHVGGEYAMTERLNLSGSVWKDFSNLSGQLSRSPFLMGRQGVDFRADYKVNKNITITGRVRYSEGNAPNSMMHGNSFNDPFFY